CADKLSGYESAGIAILMLTCSVFEPVGRVITGKPNAFVDGFKELFKGVNGSEDVAEDIHICVRHGLFHEGFVKPGISLDGRTDTVSKENGRLRINPVLFLRQT